MEYKVLQLKDIKKVKYAFMDYDFAKKHSFNLSDYNIVYEGDIPLNQEIRKTKDVFIVLDSLLQQK